MVQIISATIADDFTSDRAIDHNRHFEKPYCEKREDSASLKKDSWLDQDKINVKGF